MQKSKIIKVIIGLFLVAVLAVFFLFFTNNTQLEKEEFFVEIPTGSNYDDAKKILSPYVKSMSSFEIMAKLRSYPDNVKPGRFLLKKGMNTFQIVGAMRRNVPVDLAFNNQERLENLCERLSSQIEPDTTKLLAAFRDTTFLQKNGFSNETVFSMFLPNTYQVYWNISAEKFRDKMLEEYNKFWNKERITKATALNLTPVQVTTLASIVQKESAKKSERPIVAGVYLNRLAKEMPLQADPTVIYALKLRDNDFDQVIKRVLYNDLFIASPYNTYQNVGLPPGPIRMASVSAIDAVLDAEEHDYMFFCAKVPKDGEPAQHAFARNGAEHAANARVYRQWLNSRKIYK
jgi:UPF0755 protein